MASTPGRRRTQAHDDLAEAGVGNADYLRLADLGMGVEELLDLAGIDVFAAADDHVAGTAGDVEAAVFAHDAEVAGVQPAVGLDDFARCLRGRRRSPSSARSRERRFRPARRCGSWPVGAWRSTWISVCGMARPTVLTRISMVSPASLMVTTGEVSVWP